MRSAPGAGRGRTVQVRYMDPSYQIRSVPASSTDRSYPTHTPPHPRAAAAVALLRRACRARRAARALAFGGGVSARLGREGLLLVAGSGAEHDASERASIF